MIQDGGIQGFFNGGRYHRAYSPSLSSDGFLRIFVVVVVIHDGLFFSAKKKEGFDATEEPSGFVSDDLLWS